MKLYSYIVTHDTGFSPNPFWGHCTLADCKPTIRRTAKIGDWIVGLSSKTKGNTIIYAMCVEEILHYDQYYRDSRFVMKIPNYTKRKVVYKCGDNIYRPTSNGEFHQLQSMHSKGVDEDPEAKAHDLGGVNVLISSTFHYFGSSGPELPIDLNDLIVGRAHKNRFSKEKISKFLDFISRYPKGISASPTNWPISDKSWQQEEKTKLKLILSRKGFDSSSGGVPSPILPDGRMVSLPIPDKMSPILYSDIKANSTSIGPLVSQLTKGRIPPHYRAHLDPDLTTESLSRLPGWRPIFGQTGAAQGHLRNNGVGPGDLFLFFGLFRAVNLVDGKYVWVKGSRPCHTIWGWLQIGEILKLGTSKPKEYEWARYHPHYHRHNDKNNVVYIASRHLNLGNLSSREIPGAGIIRRFSSSLQLTANSSQKPSIWELPAWFNPSEKRSPLTYHSDLNRWRIKGDRAELRTTARGQEFILDCDEYPEAIRWAYDLLKDADGFAANKGEE